MFVRDVMISRIGTDHEKKFRSTIIFAVPVRSLLDDVTINGTKKTCIKH
jgi:hypothetical protein